MALPQNPTSPTEITTFTPSLVNPHVEVDVTLSMPDGASTRSATPTLTGLIESVLTEVSAAYHKMVKYMAQEDEEGVEAVFQIMLDKMCRRSQSHHVDAWVEYSFCYFAGTLCGSLQNELAGRPQLFPRFVHELSICQDTKQQLSLMSILFEIVRSPPLLGNDLAKILRCLKPSFVSSLLDIVEQSRGYSEEIFTQTGTTLILGLNNLFVYAESMRYSTRFAVDNLVITTLESRISQCQTFSENLVFMLNRETNHEIKAMLIHFLRRVFATPSTYHLLYTNDLRVLVDVVIRELSDLPADAEELQCLYLDMLGPLLCNTRYPEIRHKADEVNALLLDMTCMSPSRPVSERTFALAQSVLVVAHDILQKG